MSLPRVFIGAWSLYAAGTVWRTLARRPRNLRSIDRRAIYSIAIIRLDEMGDFALFSSILRPLRQAFPNARITLILSDWICPLAEFCPYVDQVVPFPTGGSRLRQFLLGPFRAFRVALSLDGPFDLVISPRFDRDIRGAAFLAHFSLAPWVLGYPSSTESVKALMNRGYDRFYTHLIPVTGDVLHEVERNRKVLEFLGIPGEGISPELWISEDDRRRAHLLLRQEGWRPGETLVCLGITAAYARRRWPIDSFAQLAERLMSQADCRFLIVGSAPDREAAELLRPALGSRLIDLAGRAGLRVSAAALAECRVYVGNDSGPMHLAAALGKPVVEISCHPRDGDAAHFQSPARFGAFGCSSVVVAPAQALAPCTTSCMADQTHCITQVSVDAVFEVVVTLVEVSQPVHHL